MKFNQLIKHLIGFAHLLRSEGFLANPDQSKSFLLAIKALGPRSLRDIRLAAHAIFAPSPEKREIFNELFDQHFLGTFSTQPLKEEQEDIHSDQTADTLGSLEDSVLDPGQTASMAKIIKRKEFTASDDIFALKQFLRIAPKRLPEKITRRTHPNQKGNKIDRARTIKTATKNGGEIFKIFKKNRIIKLRPLVILIDISGSMKSYTEGALGFAHALIKLPTKVEVFSLGTELTRLTPALKSKLKDQALNKISKLVDDFDGGTNLGETLGQFLSTPKYKGFARGATVVSISDGLEIGNSDALLSSSRKLHSLAFAHIWLTPLAKTRNFNPQTEALKRIAPYVDEFGSAISIAHICAHLLGEPIPKEAS